MSVSASRRTPSWMRARSRRPASSCARCAGLQGGGMTELPGVCCERIIAQGLALGITALGAAE